MTVADLAVSEADICCLTTEQSSPGCDHTNALHCSKTTFITSRNKKVAWRSCPLSGTLLASADLGKAARLPKHSPSQRMLVWGKDLHSFSYMFICVSSVDPHSTGLAPMLCVRLWVSCQPSDSQRYSAVCVWNISIFPFLFPRNPSTARSIRIMCRTRGLLRRGSHTSSNEGLLSLTLKGAWAVLVPCSSLLIFIP